MRPEWEKGLRGQVYAFGRRVLPLAWRRAVRRRLPPERLLGIRKPPPALKHFPFDARALPPGRPDILILPVIPWSYRRQRPQQLAEALARRGKRVFYGTLEGDAEATEPTGVAPGVTLLPLAGVRREDPADLRLEGRSLQTAVDSITQAREQLGLQETALLLDSPFWTPLALRLRDLFGWKILYDCLDEHAAFETNRAGPLAASEEELLGSADLVIVTSEPLRERILQARPDSRLLPNACDFELFSAVPDPVSDPERLVVGYAGAIDRWFDAELLARIAQLRPGWSFEIVGALENEPDLLPRGAPNVTFFGERPHGEMPSFRGRWDVEIIPFLLSALTHATDPVKLYEAAAAGRPVVATTMRSLESMARLGLVRLADNPEDFVRAIEESASQNDAGERREFARNNTWDVRAEQLCEWIAPLFLHTPIEGGRPRWEDVAALARRRGAAFHFPASIGWDVVLVQRPHHLARAFSRRGFPVVFDVGEETRVDSGLTEVEPGLFLNRGADLPPGGLPGRVCWAFARNLPSDEALGDAKLVYDVIDHLDVFPGRAKRLLRNHEHALRRAHCVFAVSALLLEDVREDRPEAIYLPNGVDCAHFAAPIDPAAVPRTLQELRARGRPVAGYVGALARWVDAELLAALAFLRPDWTFALIGEVLDDSMASSKNPTPANLVFLGPSPYAAIPSVMSAFDVGLIPFRRGPEALHASPIKLYEYLAAGLPVLATPIAECESMPETLVACDAKGFAELLDTARSSRGSEEYRRRAHARARESDWSRRARTVLQALELEE